MNIKFTQGKNYIKKPHAYARDHNENYNREKINTTATSALNNPITSIKNIKCCHECGSEKLDYIQHLDMTWCESCGLVIKQGFNDCTPLEDANFARLSCENKKIQAMKLMNKSL